MGASIFRFQVLLLVEGEAVFSIPEGAPKDLSIASPLAVSTICIRDATSKHADRGSALCESEGE